MEKILSEREKKSIALDILVFLGVIAYFVLRIIYSSGEFTPDSIQYLQQAQDFWDYKVNFPLGYPFLINIFSLFTGSLIIASKLINILSYIGIILFSYKKKFFFPQTLFIFSFYPFLGLYTLTLSESVYYFFNYLIIYFVYKIIEGGFNTKRIFSLAILFFILTSIRFSGVFVFATAIAFLGYITFKKKYSIKSYSFLVISTLFGVLSYLLINYLYCGFPLGQRDHLHIEPENCIEFISRISVSTCKDFSFLNAIIHKGLLNKISFINIFVGAVLIITAFLVLLKKGKKISYFNLYLAFSFIGILLTLLYSYYTTRIDDTIRIKSNVYLYLVLLIAFNIPRSIINYAKVFVIFTLGINSFTLIKHSESIIKHIPKYETLICKTNDKSINIIYKNYKDSNEKNNSAVLLFKAILIDKGYKFLDSEQPDPKVSNCQIQTSEIIK
ncbi:hypothetical protein [Chryseobacterium oryctis]|uniref:Glycosyltransferase RgtA/B/C/D-like domain-containing protein n=1 Tax=Chryseobacterium oryctis TaxID=2952618 RepID=A0ABT3HL06_9FLAO|nr:hypothetical protein [Chryseobacterium oryctis]MCW3160403.1 hypothetical protein [Chryseobacterium oryctis]